MELKGTKMAQGRSWPLCGKKVYQRELWSNGSMVIVNMGFCSFSLPEDVYKCQCPLCSKSVTPVTCAFNNCRWKWAGSKYEPLPNPPTKYSGKWKVADNAYHQFKPNNSGGGKAQWLTQFTQKILERSQLFATFAMFTALQESIPMNVATVCIRNVSRAFLSFVKKLATTVLSASWTKLRVFEFTSWQ